MDANTILLGIIAIASVATAVGTVIAGNQFDDGSDPKDPIKTNQ